MSKQSPLNSDQLKAFEVVARLGNFTSAAAELLLTQPALSRRIQSLETSLTSTLFLRKPSGVELTDAGCRLLRFVETKGLLESELRADLHQSASGELRGLVRIAGYSSVLHEVVTPAVGAFLRANPKVTIHYQATQGILVRERLVDLLLRAESDLLLSKNDFGSRDIESRLLGSQELIAVESTRYATKTDRYLDARPGDDTTTEFFKFQHTRPPAHISYLYDESGILKAVTEGIGRAVVYRSMVRKGMLLRPVRGTKPMRQPMFLNWRKQPYYAPTFEGVRNGILELAPKT